LREWGWGISYSRKEGGDRKFLIRGAGKKDFQETITVG